ncbi:MAG: type II toxin-antitoxin system Phd/YefM family antitoxin [Chloroflexi bacterium]|nr:type II toxin-antitoxin system Phd/YefM family antitoxin [Chloroflexota bacterium]MBK8933371.1 type II toxin-antitoxin system Phd/YefM family antitoxin [Chloroflexota bacterium]
MSKTITSTELQKKTREMIDWARMEGEAIVIQTYGKPMAALVSYDEYQNYLQYKQARADRFALLRETAADNEAYNSLTEAEAMAIVEQTRQEAHEDQSGRME